MMKWILAKYKQYQEVISYLFWGVVTTVVNIGIFIILKHITGWNYQIDNAIAWFVSVVVAFISNKAFVFKSQSVSLSQTAREFVSFTGGRVATLLIESLILWVGISLLHGNDVIVKIIDNVVVVIINYFWSKWAVFNSKTK
ncbi:GtrA family protein [Lentilactobacillus senioris]|uniref:Cell wall teichoic acid glycosylation protein GtcA n=1 Tax=Lentilactobacillus senioris DSM 24302 = JCM 17472 TaxID=1423802 RepID=A0A0R2CNA7_9LACO|nr:GtrA family protein [Lentilactobacillus senioris]KRM93089.1 cell wall teichoic acid glycosylation protein GtcA [Lentilactobacillus senioris DSM 24302 = JCM 17472]